MYYYDIQLLRGISILIIILFHFNKYENGYIGVDSLFVVSAFLLKNSDLSNRINYVVFICNRIARIFPLLYIILISFFLIYANVENTLIPSIMSEVQHGAIFLSNYYYQKMENNYFYPNSLSKFLNLWAISVEMQYYVICKIFIAYDKINYLFIVISFLYYLLKNTALYYSLLGRLYQFNLGLLIHSRRINIKRENIMKSLLLLILLFFPYQVLFKYSHIFSTSFVLLYIYINSSYFSVYMLNHIGDISYALYLLHYPLKYIIKGNSYVVILYITSYILTKIDKYIYSRIKNMPVRIIISFSTSLILLFITLSYVMEYNSKKRKNIYSKDFKLTILESYSCHISNYNYNSILVIGDSHSLPLLHILYKFCKKKSILLYYKFVHTAYVVNLQKMYLLDLSTNFTLIIYTHHYKKANHPNFNKTYLLNHIKFFIKYLTNYTKYVIYIIPTPYLYHPYSCKDQISLKYANNNIMDFNFLNVSSIRKIAGILILNFTKFFCGNNFCNLTLDGTCIYMDTNHLIEGFFTFLTPYVITTLTRLKIFKYEKSVVPLYNGFILLNNRIHKEWKLPKRNCIINYLDVPF